MAVRRQRKGQVWEKLTPSLGGIWLVRFLGAYVLLQFGWWAYLLASSGGESERWMVLGEGSVFATLLIVGLIGLEKSVRREQERIARERNLLLGVTHELKTPLANVQLGLDSLRRLSLDENDKARVLTNMQQGVSDLGRLVEDMLVATRLQRQNEVQHSEFDWSEVAEEVVSRVSEVQQHRVNLDISGKENQKVFGDRALWVLSASNLVENALKYSEGAVTLHMAVASEVAVLQVSDEGVGIPKDQRKKVLAPFVRLTQEESGSGLGLHLVAQTAQLHGATVEMRDHEPSGFSIRVIWPQAR